MIDIIITSYKEPQSTIRAVKTFLKQKVDEEFRIIVVDPFPEVEETLKKAIKDPRVQFFLDPGEGKSAALNMLFQEYASSDTNDIFILTDGDVVVSDNAIADIRKAFHDAKVGCVTGKPVPVDPRNTKYGYWAHVAFSGIDKVRKQLSQEQRFFECSGYLFAVRKGVLLDFPLEASEDSIIPHLFWKKGYSIQYVDTVEVYVKNPSNWKDWLAQKVRNIKGHENLKNIAPDMQRTKSFWNEIRHGAMHTLKHPRNLKEVFWTAELYAVRLYLYAKAFKEIKGKKKYEDGWRGQAVTESTRME